MRMEGSAEQHSRFCIFGCGGGEGELLLRSLREIVRSLESLNRWTNLLATSRLCASGKERWTDRNGRNGEIKLGQREGVRKHDSVLTPFV